MPIPSLPTGTVTFLFTDVEGSTRLAQQHPADWARLQDRHHAILREAIERQRGYIFKTVGDSFCAAFHQPGDALRAALDAQRSLAREPWSPVPVRVRMGIHTGLAEPDGADYRGYLALSSVSRLMSAAHGGQVLLSQSAVDLLESDLPEEAGLRDMGLHRLKDLLRPQHLYQLVLPDLPCDFPPLHTLDLRPHNLPVQLTSFVGREKELRELVPLVASSRLLTLTGAGGTGKTRLALQLAAEVLDEFKDGAWLTELAALSDPDLVPQAIARSLSVQEQSGRLITDVLHDYLRPRDLLLILDNVEHLLDACALLTDDLLHAAPGLRILITGREALGISGETTYPVRSLPLPAALPAPNAGDIGHLALPASLASCDSVRLFVERAASVQPSFQLTGENAAAVAEICTRLDGIPLAIELAAARVSGVGVQDIAARLGDRFRLLTGGSRTALPRHRTLAATIDWSYNLLSPDERLVLSRLSVFAGGWSLAAAESACSGGSVDTASVLDLLTHLVDKSLVVLDHAPAGARYRMLESLREYARDRFPSDDERQAAQQRHCDYFIGLAEHAYAARDRDPSTWLERLEQELDNLRAALDWAAAHLRAQELQLAGALGWFWEIRSHYAEGNQRLEAALLDQPGNSAFVRRARIAAGYMALSVADGSTARREFDAALSLAREANSQEEMAKALRGMGEARMIEGDYAAAQRDFEGSLGMYRGLGDLPGTAWLLSCLSQSHAAQDDPAAACRDAEEAHRIALSLGEPWLLENAEHCMGDAGLFHQDCAAAAQHYARAIALGRRLGNVGQNSFDLEGLAMAAAGAGDAERALQLVGAAMRLRDSMQNWQSWAWWEELKDRWLGPAYRLLGPEAAERLIAHGRSLDVEQAIEYALA